MHENILEVQILIQWIDIRQKGLKERQKAVARALLSFLLLDKYRCQRGTNRDASLEDIGL